MFCYRIRSTTRRNTGTEDWEIHSAERYNLLACCQMHAHVHRCKLALEMHVQNYILHWLVYLRKEEDCTIPELFNLYLNYAHFVKNLIICNFLNFLCGFSNYHIFYLPLISSLLLLVQCSFSNFYNCATFFAIMELVTLRSLCVILAVFFSLNFVSTHNTWLSCTNIDIESFIDLYLSYNRTIWRVTSGSWPDSPTGRALHRLRRGQGSFMPEFFRQFFIFPPWSEFSSVLVWAQFHL